MTFTFPDPPTELSLADAKRVLDAAQSSMTELDTKIDAAEATLARVIQESRYLIGEMQSERTTLEKRATLAKAYLSPIRRLPTELLRDIFTWSFEEHPCCAWVLAAVCVSWRRLSLRMPKIWSKIRLLTTQHASADTIRLWLERSGDTVPLDIEVYLRVTSSGASAAESPARLRRHRSRTPSPPPWAMSFTPNHGIATHYVIPPPPGITILPPTHAPIALPPSPSGLHDPWLGPRQQSNDRQAVQSSRSSLHWGHVAIYYLAEQMHRWERFIFRFDKQFTSMGALKSISGDAPLLKEFEVSSAEAVYWSEGQCQWLPNAPSNATIALPKLQTLTLQYTPFKWSSPMLRTNLHTLNLRALPTPHLPLDRVLYIVANNPNLESLTLHFQVVLPAVLPLSPTLLSRLKTFHIGGYNMLSQLVDVLSLPSLESLTLDLETRDPIEDTIINLLARSNSPSLAHLSIAYSSPTSPSSSFYYGPTGVVVSWTTLLAELAHLRTLHVGGTPLEPMLSALGVPDDETNQIMGPWACPRLETLGIRNCHAHSEVVGKLVQLIEVRNPPLIVGSISAGSGAGIGISGAVGGSGILPGGAPARLKVLELHECVSLGEDVLAWLKSRIREVVWKEPEFV